MSRRRLLGGLLVAMGVLSGFGALTLHQAESAKAALLRAKADVSRLEDELRAGDTSHADALLATIRHETSHAHSLTSWPQWALAAHLPGQAGRTVRLTRGLTATLATISDDALPGLVRAAHDLQPSTLVHDHRVTLTSLSGAQAPVAKAARIVTEARRTVSRLAPSGVAALDDARTQLLTQLAKVAGELSGSQDALRLLPPMLGATAPRTYFLAFQNPAEARGTGGFVGAFGILSADHGAITLESQGTDQDLVNTNPKGSDEVPVDLGGETYAFNAQWDAYGSRSLWVSSNYTANFPWAAAVWRAKYAYQTATTPVDGALALDPVGIGQLLGSRSVTLSDGEVIPGSSFATFVTQTLQERFPTEATGPARKRLLLEASQKAFDVLLSGGSASGLLHGLQAAAGGGHIQVWSAHADEEAILAKGVIAGQVPEGAGPFAWLGIDNASGNKGDIFLDRSMSFVAGACPTGKDKDRESTITVTLTNQTPVDAPAIQSGRFDDLSGPVAPDTQREYAFVETTHGSSLEGATMQVGSGKVEDIDVEPGVERGHPLYLADVELPHGIPVTITFHLTEPAQGRLQTFRSQPLVRPLTSSVKVPPCA